MNLLDFLSGAITFGFLIAALHFARFWRSTGDTLFLSFAGAFVLLAFGQGLLSLSNLPTEERSWLYLIRLAAFALIMAAIVRKNRPTG